MTMLIAILMLSCNEKMEAQPEKMSTTREFTVDMLKMKPQVWMEHRLSNNLQPSPGANFYESETVLAVALLKQRGPFTVPLVRIETDALDVFHTELEGLTEGRYFFLAETDSAMYATELTVDRDKTNQSAIELSKIGRELPSWE